MLNRELEEFLAQHPKVRFHFTPTYSSWLNQAKLWFAKIQRDMISRGIFTSVADLGRKLRKYIEAYARLAKPFRWTYTDPLKRIRINEITGTLYEYRLAASTSYAKFMIHYRHPAFTR